MAQSNEFEKSGIEEAIKTNKRLKILSENKIPDGYRIKTNGVVFASDMFFDERRYEWETLGNFIKNTKMKIEGLSVEKFTVPVLEKISS